LPVWPHQPPQQSDDTEKADEESDDEARQQDGPVQGLRCRGQRVERNYGAGGQQEDGGQERDPDLQPVSVAHDRISNFGFRISDCGLKRIGWDSGAVQFAIRNPQSEII